MRNTSALALLAFALPLMGPASAQAFLQAAPVPVAPPPGPIQVAGRVATGCGPGFHFEFGFCRAGGGPFEFAPSLRGESCVVTSGIYGFARTCVPVRPF